nr:metal ABC transporter permease [Salinicola tamaricis]
MPEFLQFAFMRNAFVATTLIALMGSLVGYFVVLRRQAFASHALSNIGFAGAAGASLAGVDPMLGLLLFVMGAALVMAWTGRDLGERDVSVGMILMFSLGLGALFVNLYSANANAAIGILFGSVFGIDAGQIRWIAITSAGVLLGLGAIFRPLRFASLNPQAARAQGIPVATFDTLFLLLVGAAAAIAVPVIGSLLSSPSSSAPPPRLRPGVAVSVWGWGSPPCWHCWNRSAGCCSPTTPTCLRRRASPR